MRHLSSFFVFVCLIFGSIVLWQGCQDDYKDPVSPLDGGSETTFDGKDISITGIGFGYASDYTPTTRLLKGNSEVDIELYQDGDPVYLILTNQQGAAIYSEYVGTWPGTNGFFTCPPLKVTWGDYRAFAVIGHRAQAIPMYVKVNNSAYIQLTQVVHGKSPKGNEYDYFVFSLVSKCSGSCTSVKQTYDNLNTLHRGALRVSYIDLLTKNGHLYWGTSFPNVNPPYPQMNAYWTGANCCDEHAVYVSNFSETAEEYIGGEGTRYVTMHQISWNDSICVYIDGFIVKETGQTNSYTFTVFKDREPQNPPLGVGMVYPDELLLGAPGYNKDLVHLFDQAWGQNGTFYYVFQVGFDAEDGVIQGDDNRVEMITLHGEGE